jgi:transcriptional antiterminator RfaH
VRFGEHHPSVPEEVVEALMGQAASVTEGVPLFATGETVRLESGPFAGLTAVFDMPKGNDRAQVLIQMLGKGQQLVVDADQLAKNN